MEKDNVRDLSDEAFEQYKKDIKKYLMECAWKYKADSADRTINHYIKYVREGFEKGVAPEDIGIDIGYCCG